jgi:hypothetical protein
MKDLLILMMVFFVEFDGDLRNFLIILLNLYISFVATLLWPSVGVKPNTWKK